MHELTYSYSLLNESFISRLTGLQTAMTLPDRWSNHSVIKLCPFVKSLHFSSSMFANRVVYIFYWRRLHTCQLCSC